jgi:prepilin-type N-terminal cleavage/methylation domain-containing protein
MHSRGFTLVETFVAIALLAVILVAVSAFQANVFKYNRHSQTALTNTQEAQAILKNITKELRTMTRSANGAYPILSAATNTLTFYADTTGDTQAERVRYYLASSTLYRGVIKPSGSPAVYNPADEKTNILATGIGNSTSTPVFEYYLGTHDGTTDAMTYPIVLTSIRLVKININIDSDPTKSPIPRLFTTKVSLRNLKDNL